MSSVPRSRIRVIAFRTLLAILLLADLGYTFWQQHHTTLDGDIAKIVLPSPDYAPVLKDPLGWNALTRGEYSVGPNRFMLHWSMERWYKLMPRALQWWKEPLDRVYLTGAIAKTAFQAMLLYLMSVYASGTLRPTRRRFLLAALLLTPFFQTFGFNWQFGIIDLSVTYSFAYAYASAWLLLYFLPYFFWAFHRHRFRGSVWLSWAMVPLAWVTAFNGPLNAAVMLMLCPLLLVPAALRALRNPQGVPRWRAATDGIPTFMIVGALSGMAFAILSYWIGRYNLEGLSPTVSLSERYARLPAGLVAWYTDGPGPSVFLVPAIGALAMVMLVTAKKDRHIIQRWALALLLFATIYIALLPLGGYRDYRPNIVRRDSILPVLLGVLMLYAVCGLRLLLHRAAVVRLIFFTGAATVAVYLTRKDVTDYGGNLCERAALAELQHAATGPVLLEQQCNVMNWRKVEDSLETRHNAALLHYWDVLDKPRLYYQR